MITAGKAATPGYEPQPFFFVDRDFATRGGDHRLAAWTGNIELTRILFGRLTEMLCEGEDLRLLFRVESASGWDRYFGTVQRAEFLNQISRFDDLIFLDGYSQLCVRDAEYAEYFVLDETSTFFIYSHHPGVKPLLLESGLQELETKTLHHVEHMRRQLDDIDLLRHEFIEHFSLQWVPRSAGTRQFDPS